jgi:hypothetical protein
MNALGMGDAGWTTTRLRQVPLSDYVPRVLPDGWRILQPWGDGNVYRYRDQLTVIVTTADFPDGRDWMHISCSRKDRLPSFDDLKFAKSTFAGDGRYAYQVFPPADKYVNIHPFSLHLWAPLNGAPPLPDFTSGGNSI